MLNDKARLYDEKLNETLLVKEMSVSKIAIFPLSKTQDKFTENIQKKMLELFVTICQFLGNLSYLTTK